MIKLGDLVKDEVTGFTGIASGKADYLTGCTQFHVQPICDEKQDKYPDGYWLDAPKLKVVKKAQTKIEIKTKKDKGCDTKPPQM